VGREHLRPTGVVGGCVVRRSGYRREVGCDGDLRRRFRPEPAAVAQVRGFLRDALAQVGSAPGGDDLVNLLIMGANELATNAVIHARTDFTVAVLIEPDRVRIDVSDANTRMPQPCLTPVYATSGRGLARVVASGLGWGAERHAAGKTVWVQVGRSG
jgi:hypothetical protein